MIFVPVALACGPDFPPYLLALSPEQSLEPMVGDFDQMLRPFVPAAQLPAAVSGSWKEVETADAKVGLPEGLVEPWMAARTAAREGRPFTTPQGLPPEYAFYLEGSALWHRDRCADVRPFVALLNLSPDGRRNRTTWAEWMLAACAVGEERTRMWGRLRYDAAHGFADRWGLAASSYGEEALDYGLAPTAFHLYLQQAASDPQGVTSLIELSRRALDTPASLPALAADPDSAGVLSAYVASRDTLTPERAPDEDDARRLTWLRYARSPSTNAGTLAWLAYQSARYEEAARWVGLAATDDGWARWVEGRLALRDGRLADADRALSAAAAHLPDRPWETAYRFRSWDFTPDGEAAAEAATVDLAEGRYAEALEGLLGTRYWLDAAYVAERVLTVDELQAFVDTKVPEVATLPKRPDDWPYDYTDTTGFWGCGVCDTAFFHDRLRWLLARRLVRAGRVDEAVVYAPPRLRERFLALRDAPTAIDHARRLRVDGLEIAGTELDPDYAVFEGDYELTFGPDRMARTDTLGPSADERARYAASAPSPDRRYHYRFVAGQALHDWAAALPDDDPRVAWSYCTAGRWVQSRNWELASGWYHEALRRRIDRSGVPSWFGECGEEPPAPAWWWPWRKELAEVPRVVVALGFAGWWRIRRRTSPRGATR